MYTHVTFTLMAQCTSGAVGSVSCSRTLRQGIELATWWLLSEFSTSCTTVGNPHPMSQVMGQNNGIVVMSEGWLMAGRYSASGACIKGLCQQVWTLVDRPPPWGETMGSVIDNQAPIEVWDCECWEVWMPPKLSLVGRRSSTPKSCQPVSCHSFILL